MAKKRKKSRSILNSTFYRIYFVIVAVCLIAIVVGTVMLNGILKDYEDSQPIYVANQVGQLFKNGNFESIFDIDTSMADIENEDRDFYIESLREITNGKNVTWSESYSGNADRKVYTVMLDGDKFAEFTLIPSGVLTEKGNKVWTLSSITTNISIEPEATPEPSPTPSPTPEPETRILCRIIAPSDSAVTVDGKEMTANDVLNGNVSVPTAALLPEVITAPTLTEYGVYSETGKPEIRVIDKNGNPQTPEQTAEYTWSCGLAEQPGLKEQVEENVITVAKKLAQFSSKDAKKGAITQYCASKSPARAILDSYDPQWGSSHKSMSFENIVTSDYIMYGDNCFTCHISFDYVANFNKTDSTTYPTAYTFCFVKQKNTWKLWNFSFN